MPSALRTWLPPALAGVAISGLGLAVAASTDLISSAEQRPAVASSPTATPSEAAPAPAQAATAGPLPDAASPSQLPGETAPAGQLPAATQPPGTQPAEQLPGSTLPGTLPSQATVTNPPAGELPGTALPGGQLPSPGATIPNANGAPPPGSNLPGSQPSSQPLPQSQPAGAQSAVPQPGYTQPGYPPGTQPGYPQPASDSATSASPTPSTPIAVGGVPAQLGSNAYLPNDPRLAVFTRTRAAAPQLRTPQLQAALVHEWAAQRSERLAKEAASISQAAKDAGGAARSQQLDTTEQAIRQAAVRLAQQRLASATQARVGLQEQLGTTPAPTATGLDPGSVSVAPGGGSSSPIPGAAIGARFGQYGLWARYHTGVDFRASAGTPIRAAANGIVIYAGNSGDWAGNHVAIRHASGITTMSSHMSSMAVKAGESVKAGQVIGYVGSTGRAFGAHLHFEVYPAGVKYGDIYRAVNPVLWLRSIGVQVG